MFPEPLCREADSQNGDRDNAVPFKPNTNVVYRCNGNATADLEVVVLVEGIDAVTSATIQIRHSYKDILFNHRHVNCVDVDPETGGAVVDFRRFHETKPVEPVCNKVAGGFY
ncbi:hypothetical protein PHMEG_00039043 [Phytophthora megakarya]|uniref:Inward rectifier potassium channel C-terminal domain-containing protein n=1 Tax=Phytophthora megakarya TaxID=4795 RepID=A0A225UHL9_9STRA|nr:hypothetical protein PHMEG_00039043 [Phytophthora megakarya]